MTKPKLDNVKQTLGFFSMTVAWGLMNLFHSIYLVWRYGKADDSEVVIFWSGLFMTIAWAIFIIYPLKRLNHSAQVFKPSFFPLISGLYGALAYAIIVGGLFRSLDLVIMFIPLALLAGFFFGITYSQLIRLDKLIFFLIKTPAAKIVFFISPAVILFVFLLVLPTLAPSLVFRYMPDQIRDKIVAQTIPKYKVGDDFEPLKDELPGYLDNFEDGSGNLSATMKDFVFVLQVNCNKIIRIEYGKEPKDIDGTIYGKLHEQPCL